MEQFSLEKYLENPSRKVVTRRGRSVRIICTDANEETPIAALVTVKDIGLYKLATALYTKDGRYGVGNSPYDLFFADEEEKPQSIEIPFGAFDSEFVKDEYYIPEGCEARIEGNKIIIEKIQKEELTEFKEMLASTISAWQISMKDSFGEGNYQLLKKDAKELLDLARKELLKDLPKWKKATENKDFDTHVLLFEDEDKIVLTEGIYKDEYYIELDDLKTLPKEE